MLYKSKGVYTCALLFGLVFSAHRLNSFEGEDKKTPNNSIHRETHDLTLETKEGPTLSRKKPVEYFTKEHPHLLEKAAYNLSHLSLFLLKDEKGNLDFTDNRN